MKIKLVILIILCDFVLDMDCFQTGTLKKKYVIFEKEDTSSSFHYFALDEKCTPMFVCQEKFSQKKIFLNLQKHISHSLQIAPEVGQWGKGPNKKI